MIGEISHDSGVDSMMAVDRLTRKYGDFESGQNK
jgi:hypothetical protein